MIITILMIFCSVNILGCNNGSSKNLKEEQDEIVKQSEEIQKLQGEVDDGERILELIEQYPNINTKPSSSLNSEELQAKEEVLQILDRNPEMKEYICK